MEKQANNLQNDKGKNEEKDQSQKTLLIILGVIAGALLLGFLALAIGGAFWLKSYKNKLEKEYQQDVTALQNYSPADSSLESTVTEPSFTPSQSKVRSERYPSDSSYLAQSIYYWNCKYYYSLSYPQNWTIDDKNNNAMQVFIKGSGVTVKLESIGLTPGETLQELANRRNEAGKISPDTAGINVWSETIDWGGVKAIETDYVKPDAIIIHWLRGNRGMEMMIFGTGFNNQFTEIEKMLSTLEVNLLAMVEVYPGCPAPASSSSSSSSSSSPSTKSSFNCDSWIHPNGDIEYWWDSISPQEKNCYVSKYGAPPFYEP